LTQIVGLGASAGGLEALEEFLAHTPAATGMAYVVVQHLDPTQKDMLPELLRRITPMPVHQARHGMRIRMNCVYVIPPNAELSVVNDTLKLALPSEPRGMRLPVNVLFASLASSRGERAIGVVLSGMGADGTLGLQAIKAVGGLAAAQEPASTKFDSMPRSAIAAGCVDIVAPPAELPARILACMSRMPDPERRGERSEAASPGWADSLKAIVRLLQQRTRHDFSHYKPSTMNRRIDRRMAIHGIGSLADYAQFLVHNQQELDLLFRELLIGVTSFFRDGPVWDYLENSAIPELLERRREDLRLRIWVVGCSTGEEAYSLAMVLSEAIRKLPDLQKPSVQIFASDLNPEAIATARRGKYPLSIVSDVPEDRLARYFSAHDTHYQVNQSLRDMVLFAEHDVVLDPPFTRLDLVACRNLLIYFDATLQRKLLPLFHYSLRSGGLLLLGSSETAEQSQRLFAPVQSQLKLYLRQEIALLSGFDKLPMSFPPLTTLTKDPSVPPKNSPGSDANDNLQAAADQVLLQVFAPAAVVINAEGDIVYISGRTGKYLEPAAGKANWNIHAMAREGLRIPLFHALKQVAESSEPVQLRGLEVAIPGGTQTVDVVVQAPPESGALRGLTMIVFHDAAPLQTGRRKGKPAASSAASVQQYQDEISRLREEARATREELQSANEELQSTNEELQSTNEELTTSKEEMQSMNEELQTINNELQSKLDDLSLAQSDMQNVLNSIEIAILFLDQNLHVRRFTERAAKIINLRESDIGRPLSDLTTSLQYPALHDDALQTLRTLVFVEKQVTTSDGRWFSTRIMPYRRLDNVIDGVVITLVDITATKELETALRRKAGP
jgi:two-component system CheB/CheR fusion protein